MKDINKRIALLPEEKRTLLAKLSRQRHRRVASRRQPRTSPLAGPPEHTLRDEYDIVITGGGLAGLAPSIQLRRALPDRSVLVVNSTKHPAPEAGHKVGGIIGGNWRPLRYDSVLAIQSAHGRPATAQDGLALLPPYGDNRGLARRVELGPFENHVLPIPSATKSIAAASENMLAVNAGREGVGFIDECRVSGLTLGEGGAAHTIELKARRRAARGASASSRRRLGTSRDHPAQAGPFETVRSTTPTRRGWASSC